MFNSLNTELVLLNNVAMETSIKSVYLTYSLENTRSCSNIKWKSSKYFEFILYFDDVK